MPPETTRKVPKGKRFHDGQNVIVQWHSDEYVGIISAVARVRARVSWTSEHGHKYNEEFNMETGRETGRWPTFKVYASAEEREQIQNEAKAKAQLHTDWSVFRQAVTARYSLPEHLTSADIARMTAILTGTQEEPRP